MQICSVILLTTLPYAGAVLPSEVADVWACSKTAEMGIQAQNLGESINSLECGTHLPVANNLGDHNDFSSRVTGFELNDRLNGDVVVAEAAADLANHAWGIFCFETHIIALAGPLCVHQVASPPARGCEQGIQIALGRIELTDARNVEDVGDHS